MSAPENLSLMPEIQMLRTLLGHLGAKEPDEVMEALALAKTVPRVASVLIRAVSEEARLRAGIVGDDGLADVVAAALEEMEADRASNT